MHCPRCNQPCNHICNDCQLVLGNYDIKFVVGQYHIYMKEVLDDVTTIISKGLKQLNLPTTEVSLQITEEQLDKIWKQYRND